MRKLIFAILSFQLLFGMGNDNINYDEQFDSVDESLSTQEGVEPTPTPISTPMPIATPKPIKLDRSEILSNLVLRTYTRKEKNGKYIPVKYVVKNTPVVYINQVINRDDTDKSDIIVKNPIPKGVEYIKGSATCDSGCKIFYSNDNGETLLSHEEGRINYIEFYFKKIPANREVRMGFKAIVREGG